MVTTSEDHLQSELWYLDTGCSNHMTSHKQWLCDLDTTRKTKVPFADDRTLCAEGIGNIVIKMRDGKTTLIENVLYVPDMKCNLLSIVQLVEKGFTVAMKQDATGMFDPEKKLILKAPLSKNRTFQINIKAA